MAKGRNISNKNLGIVLLLGLAFQYVNFLNLPLIGKILMLLVAIALLLL